MGVYVWSYSGGSFDVAFRPQGTFYCSKYPAKASWKVEGDSLSIEWGKFGSYTFTLGGGESIDGHAVGQPTNWRKLSFKRDFDATEQALVGDGYGSVWDFEYAKGHFEVEFHADGYNHFVCKSYPAHSHWLSTEDGLVQVFWGQYGDYELRLDAATKTFNGQKSGQPANWRKAHFLRNLTAEAADLPAHDHSHDHKH